MKLIWHWSENSSKKKKNSVFISLRPSSSVLYKLVIIDENFVDSSLCMTDSVTSATKKILAHHGDTE